MINLIPIICTIRNFVVPRLNIRMIVDGGVSGPWVRVLRQVVRMLNVHGMDLKSSVSSFGHLPVSLKICSVAYYLLFCLVNLF